MGLATMSRAWVEQTCERLHLAPPYATLDEVIAAVATAIDHPIDIDAHDMEGSDIHGFCTTRAGRYKIVVAYQATRRQRIRTILHELVHILRGDVTVGHSSTVYCEGVSLRDPHELEIEAAAQALVSYLRTGRITSPTAGATPGGSAQARFWDELGGFAG